MIRNPLVRVLLPAALALAAACACRCDLPVPPPAPSPPPQPGAAVPAPERVPAEPERVEILLLTGFEPFGGSPRNASWEAVRRLDGQRIGGFEVRTLQLPVVWGAVLPALREACEAHRPAAVFSFGQGTIGRIAFERVADNERRAIPDNADRLPAEPCVLPGGPPRRVSGFPFDAVMAAYRGPSLPVGSSDEAGGYLCEECLYALETIRAERGEKPVVAFFHVPPLRSEILLGGETRARVDAGLLAEFVGALVRAWMQTRKPR